MKRVFPDAITRVARVLGTLALILGGPLLGQSFQTNLPPTLDKWMYPFEFGTGGTRPVAPTFASFDPRFDTRDAQYLLGWDTAPAFPTNVAPSKYLLKRARLVLSVSADLTFIYDPTFDSFRTYLRTNEAGYVPDSDSGRPVELFGAGFRGGFTAATYGENSPYGFVGPFSSNNISIGTRNAFAAMYDTNGVLVDVSNDVGQHNAVWTNAPFDAVPWAVGLTTNAVPGEFVPIDSKLVFDIDLSDPMVAGYLARSLASGGVRLVVSSLSPAEQITPGGTGLGGSGSYPQWATRENLLTDGPVLELEGTVVSEVDSDGDQLPDDWERFYFGDLSKAASDDSDEDGVPNATELAWGTDPRSGAGVLKIASIGTPDVPALSFPFAANRTYRVESSANLADWTAASGTLTYPSKGIAVWNGDAHETAGALFYRVVVEAE